MLSTLSTLLWALGCASIAHCYTVSTAYDYSGYSFSRRLEIDWMATVTFVAFVLFASAALFALATNPTSVPRWSYWIGCGLMIISLATFFKNFEKKDSSTAPFILSFFLQLALLLTFFIKAVGDNPAVSL